ncbi:MAG: phage tail tape measure protein, partial [Clostridiales bacterium]|nr:phage tail tape measure protein [Clostridiales bacterium]
ILGLYTELGEKSYEKLYGFYLNNTKLTEESWSDLKELTREEQQGFLDLLDTHKQEELELIAKAHQTGIITEQSNADELTQAIVDKYDERAEATREAFERINSVIETSYNEHGTLTSEALEEISGIYAQHNKDIIGEAMEHNAEWLGIEVVAYRNLAELDNTELDARLKRVQSIFEEEKIALDKSNQEKLELINALYAAQLISADEYKNQIQKVWDEYEKAYAALEKREAEITEDIIRHKKSILDKTIEWVENTKERYEDWKNSVSESFSVWKEDTLGAIEDWKKETYDCIINWYDNTKDKLSTWWEDSKTGFGDWKTNAVSSVTDWYTSTKSKFSNWWSETDRGFSDWWEDSKTGFLTWAKGIYDDVVEWFDKLWKKLKNFFEDLKFWKKEAKAEESNVKSSIASTRSSGGMVGSYSMDPVTIGHAKGGIFNKEHIARLSEGNKLEAILPVENPSAMAKVRQAIFGGEPIEMFNRLINDIISTQPSQIIYGGTQQPTPVYVGTLIADERGLRELERRLYDIRLAERHRRGE